ncbi:ankyrin repeat domain-containing protein [Kaarinaea lacus]
MLNLPAWCKNPWNQGKFILLLAVLTGLIACSGEHLSELMKAARDGNIEAVKRAIDGGAEVNYRTEKGKTALMVAASNGHTDTVKLLLDHGAQIDQQDNFGTTAIIVAATAAKTQTAEFLAQQGADPTRKDSSGGSALSNASFFGHTDTVKALLKYADNLPQQDAEELMMIASGLGHADLVDALLTHGVSPNARGIKQRTAIMAAAAFDKQEVAKLLLKNGADATLRDEDGFNAYDVAKENDNEEIYKLLSEFYKEKETGNRRGAKKPEN